MLDLDLDEKKGIFTSLVYLKEEARNLNMKKTESTLINAINAVIEDFQDDKRTKSELLTTKLFIEKALTLSSEELKNLVALIDWFEENQTSN